MTGLHLRPWEPEETIGSIWHFLVGTPVDSHASPDAAVPLDVMRGRMGVMLRGLGGGHGFSVNEATPRRESARRSFLKRIGHVEESAVVPVSGTEALEVPAVVNCFPNRELNEAYCLWLAVWSVAAAEKPAAHPDPFVNDVLRLRRCVAAISRCLKLAPGLSSAYARMRAHILDTRSASPQAAAEKSMEQVVRRFLGSTAELDALAEHILASLEASTPPDQMPASSHGYHPFKSVALWPDWQEMSLSARSEGGDTKQSKGNNPAALRRKRAKRHDSAQANRRDPLILNRFETIKTWAEMLNLARRVEDEDESQAQKAADDQDELGLSQGGKAPATRLVFDLDLSPEDVHREALSQGLLYPEWDYRSAQYLGDQVRVLESPPITGEGHIPATITPAQRRTITRVTRMFEALIPRHVMQSGETEGSEIDVEQAVRFACDRSAGQVGDDRLFRRLLSQERDLAIATLVDVSRSTESIVDERPVIDVSREALLALAHGLHATGDRHGIFSFSSLRRDRVFVTKIKDFDEPVGPAIENAIGLLRPGHYTRLGAAVRHVTKRLNCQPTLKRLLLVITDGKPNDADYYEGRYGIEDTRRAVMEARMSGVAVFGITVDRRAEAYVPHIFGRNGFTIIDHPARLTQALPGIYQHLVT